MRLLLFIALMSLVTVACGAPPAPSATNEAPAVTAEPSPPPPPPDIGPHLGWASREPSGEVFGTDNINARYFSERSGAVVISLASGESAAVYVYSADRFYGGETSEGNGEETHQYYAGRTPITLPLHGDDRIFVDSGGASWLLRVVQDNGWRLGEARANVRGECGRGFTAAAAQQYSTFIESVNANQASAFSIDLPALESRDVPRRSGFPCDSMTASMMASMGLSMVATLPSGLSVSGSEVFARRSADEAASVSPQPLAAPAAEPLRMASAAPEQRQTPQLAITTNVPADVFWGERRVGRAPGRISLTENAAFPDWVILSSPDHFQFTLRLNAEQLNRASLGLMDIHAQLVSTQVTPP